MGTPNRLLLALLLVVGLNALAMATTFDDSATSVQTSDVPPTEPIVLATTAATMPTSPIPTPDDVSVDQVILSVRSSVEAWKAGGYLLALGLFVTAIVQAFRAPALGSLVNRVPTRWRILVPTILSGVASGILAASQTVSAEAALMSWPLALGVSVFAHETGEAISGRRQKPKPNESAVPEPIA